MISYNVNKINIKKNYNIKKFISSYEVEYLRLDCVSIKCPNCNSYKMVKHGYYVRYLIIDEHTEKHSIKILRVKCKHCGKTHAILPFLVIPYIQTTLIRAIIIIDTFENNKKENYSYLSCEYRIISIFKRIWKNKLKSYSLKLSTVKSKFLNILKTFINNENKYFLQVHKGAYYFFS